MVWSCLMENGLPGAVLSITSVRDAASRTLTGPGRVGPANFNF